MLLRMYVRYGERKGFSVEVLEESEGDVAGIKSATVRFAGDYCMATCAPRPASTASSAEPVRPERPPPHLVLQRFVYPR